MKNNKTSFKIQHKFKKVLKFNKSKINLKKMIIKLIKKIK